MSNKDTIAFWLLVMYLLLLVGGVYGKFSDALATNQSTIDTAIYGAGLLFVGGSSIWLVAHYIGMKDDLHHYRSDEESRIEQMRLKTEKKFKKSKK